MNTELIDTLFLALHKQFQPHFDSITSIEILERFDSMLLLTSSSDCSVALWDIHGRQVGVFGQVTLQNEFIFKIKFNFIFSIVICEFRSEIGHWYTGYTVTLSM
jgi:WD40 repeat protein